MVSPDSRAHRARRQAETPLSVLCRFPGPALFVLEPIKEFNKQRGDTSFLLLFYRAKITNASNTDKDIQGQLKEMGAALVSTMMQIPCYKMLARLGIVPTKESVYKAAQEINGISYNIGPGGDNEGSAQRNYKALSDIAESLKIKTSFGP